MIKNKKITFVISTLGGGGAEGVCVSIANSFAHKGWKVDLVVLNLKNETYFHRLSKSINLIVLNINNVRNSTFPLLKYIYKNKPKIMFVFNYESSIIIMILRYILRFKLKIISRNINTFSIKLEQFKKQGYWTKYFVLPLIKLFYDKTDHVINQCYAMRDDLIRMYPRLTENSSVIYNPVPFHIEEYINKHDLSQIKKKNYILCVGRLEKQKAFNYAIEAFSGIKDNFPNLRLKIVGQGSLKQELKQKAIDLNVENRVDFEGFQKDIIPYYLHSKATVLTSIYEGYPNVLIESIAMNTPVVAFNCPNGPNEIIKDGINGYLVNQFDVKDLKNKLSILLEEKFDYENLKNSIKNNHSEKVFKDYESLINLFN